MTDIKVPIGRGLTQQIEKFPNIPKATPEFDKTEFRSSNSDLEFFKRIADEGRLRIDQGSFTTASQTGTAASIIPNPGETFYLIRASYVQKTQISGSIRLQNDGVNREVVTSPGANLTVSGFFGVATDALIGDGVKEYRIRAGQGAGTNSNSGTIIGYVETSPTRSSRGTG